MAALIAILAMVMVERLRLAGSHMARCLVEEAEAARRPLVRCHIANDKAQVFEHRHCLHIVRSHRVGQWHISSANAIEPSARM
ncbi:hypothetical protein BJL96_37035 [Burkholderia cenocepacia]|nr:hypothetical protein A3203_16540 [Burkholderia cenocepacia]NGO93007.1 hypothetical protein [Burkholderia cenocepacia]